MMIFSEEPYILHLLSGSDTLSALDAVKGLLDSGAHNVNEREPADNLSALHVAAAWDRLAMCQLLVHYGADLNSVDIDNRRPVDVATGKSRRFLRKLEKHSAKDRNRFRKILSFFFRRMCVSSSTKDESMAYFARPSASVIRRSCPALYSPRPMPIARPAPNLPNTNDQLPLLVPTVRVEDSQAIIEPHVEGIRQPSIVSSRTSAVDSAIEREFLSSDNTLEITGPLNVDVDQHSNDGCNPNKEHCAVSGTIAKEEQELRQQFAKLEIDALKCLLKEKNVEIGPMDAKSRRFYEGKLARLEISKHRPKQSSTAINQYSLALRRVILNEERGVSDDATGLVEDRAIINEYASSLPKNEVSFFCYLLVDPSLISAANLPIVTFRRFLSAIFYVGKGKRSRPLQHLIHASKCRSLVKNNPAQRSEKLTRIMELWDRGEGVISLNLFTNIHSGEAFVREGSMIEAIGLENLTNLQRGTFPGVAAKWTRQQMSAFGALLLKKAYVIFKNERCRPIFEADVAAMT